MIKVVCIKINDNNPPFKNVLEIGKIYEAEEYNELSYSTNGRYYILDLVEYPKIFEKKLFMTLAEYREKQINSIINE